VCGALVRDGTSRCEKHPAQAWAKRADAPKRITGRRLQRKRAELFARDPLCVMCRDKGRVSLATQRDHKLSLGEGGTDDDDNVQGLCADCHEEKTLAEALRGRVGQKFNAT
jgi:5-methylcytosine-specific restriction protein A